MECQKKHIMLDRHHYIDAKLGEINLISATAMIWVDRDI